MVSRNDSASLGFSSGGQALSPVSLVATLLSRWHLVPILRKLVAKFTSLRRKDTIMSLQ